VVHLTSFHLVRLYIFPETITAAKVSSLFILAKHIDCTAMIELKQAVTVFFIGMVREVKYNLSIMQLCSFVHVHDRHKALPRAK